MGVRLYPILKPGVTTAEFLGVDESADPETVQQFDLFGWGKKHDLIDMLALIAASENAGEVLLAQDYKTVLAVAWELKLTDAQIAMLKGFSYS